MRWPAGLLLVLGVGSPLAGVPSRSKQPGAQAPRSADAAMLAQARQLVVVSTPGWDHSQGTLQLWTRPRVGAPWQRSGSPFPAWIGRSGSAWRSDRVEEDTLDWVGPRKREGDGRSPAGLFVLGDLWGYAPQPPEGVRLPYHASDDRDRCVDDVAAVAYNQLRRAAPATGTTADPWQSAEHLRLPTDHYKLLVPIGYNGLLTQAGARSPRPGAGSCIFLHIAPPPAAGTAGCTALTEADLQRLLRALEPMPPPLFLLLPVPAQDAAKKRWGLPAELFAPQRPVQTTR